ncbi:uncharacterized protein LOC111467209 isoform X1 [Cucurbita maxima]|uniref:Uncharacterized protein LOC111467209 isoform X1 n=2 Tax=Cucurbita maxima TaxID=3661 RepID=A0A6J1HT40_CUCMA|nr:uncharacterized protein LOC111467209 isoform X1 [Cucurbita maxima]
MVLILSLFSSPIDWCGRNSTRRRKISRPSPLITSPFLQARFIGCRSFARALKMAHSDVQTPVAQHQKVIVPNKKGEKLVGILHDTGSAEVVILCHGFRSNKENDISVNIAKTLENEGISAFRFDFSGNGESEGSFQYGYYHGEADDLHAIIQYWRAAGRVISGILGHSKGGDVVLLYASKYQDINFVINVSGRYDLKKGIKERLGDEFMERIEKEGYIDVKNKKGKVDYQVTWESLKDRLNTDMHEACLLIDKECRVFTVHGSADEVIPVEDAFEFDKIIPNHKLHVVEGANHCYTSHQTELASIVLNLIKTRLPHCKDGA